MKLIFRDKETLRNIVLSNIDTPLHLLMPRLRQVFTLTEVQIDYVKSVYSHNRRVES